MNDPLLLLSGLLAVVDGFVHRLDKPARQPGHCDTPDDRGAVSIEQVLWYAAAAISVAVVAAIIWSQIRDTASTPVQSPSAP